jgi:hypothetical protein
MTADQIAEAVADILASRIVRTVKDDTLLMAAIKETELGRNTIVDATAVYNRILNADRAFDLYDEHILTPPWENVIIGYKNSYNNLILASMFTVEAKELDTVVKDYQKLKDWKWKSQNKIDWNNVKWITNTTVWARPRPSNKVYGPLRKMNWAIYEDGRPADLHWADFIEFPKEATEFIELTLLQTINFMNCRNVKLVEPKRPRAERRRIARTGLRVSHISVFPVGLSYQRGTSRFRPEGTGKPLHTVRGHFAEYGVNGKGLLFGKYSGRFFIPQHTRGSLNFGQTEQHIQIKDK